MRAIVAYGSAALFFTDRDARRYWTCNNASGCVVAYAETGESAALEELLPPGRQGFTDDSSGVKGAKSSHEIRPLRCAAKSWFTPTTYLDFLSFQALPDSERRNWPAAMLYRC